MECQRHCLGWLLLSLGLTRRHYWRGRRPYCRGNHCQASRIRSSSKGKNGITGRSYPTYIEKKKNNKASKRYHFDICNKSCESNHALELHKTSQAHINKATGVTKVLSRRRDKALTNANRAQRKFYCAFCDLACDNSSKFERHKKTSRHIEKAAKAANSMT
jgi:hypothetical protein